jgi:tight adherence protein B
MTVLILLIALALGSGVMYWMRSTGGMDTVALSARLGRFGIVTAQAADVSRIMASSRQRSEQSAVSRSVENVVGRGKFGRKIRMRLEQADLKWTTGEWFMVSLVIALIATLIGLVVLSSIGLLAGALIGLVGPWFYLGRRAKKRKQKFIEQLADMAQMMGNSMRAGFSIIQSMEMVAQEGPKPACDEFERVITEVKLGLPLDQALDHLLARMPSEDLGLAVVAINVQRQVGGNLAEILMVIAKTVRERVRFTRDLKAMTAQARYSSYIITGLPVGVAFVINLMDRPYEAYLYSTTLGHLMIGAAILMLSAGFFFLNRIANIEV